MALLAVPFADPFLIGLVETPEALEASAQQAGDDGYAGANPETATTNRSRPYPAYSRRPA
jgi:hypothetical protein